MAGQTARPFRGSSRSVAELSFRDLMCPASSIRPGPKRRRVQAPEDTPATAVVRHIQREHVLSHAGRSQDDPFGILLWHYLRRRYGQLIPQGALEYRRAQLVLAEEGKLAAVLEVEESGRPPRSMPSARAARSRRWISVNRALSSRRIAPLCVRMSHLPP